MAQAALKSLNASIPEFSRPRLQELFFEEEELPLFPVLLEEELLLEPLVPEELLELLVLEPLLFAALPELLVVEPFVPLLLLLLEVLLLLVLFF